MNQGDKRKTVKTKDKPSIKPRIMPKIEPEREEVGIPVPNWPQREPAVMPAIPIEVEIGQYQ